MPGASFKPGALAVITAKANDGSGKSAKVTEPHTVYLICEAKDFNLAPA